MLPPLVIVFGIAGGSIGAVIGGFLSATDKGKEANKNIEDACLTVKSEYEKYIQKK